MSGRTVIESWTRTAIEHAAALGAPKEALLRLVGLPPTPTGAADARIRYDLHLAVWQAITDDSAERSIGLEMAEHMLRPGAMGIVGYMVRNCATVGDTLATLEHYGPLLNENSRQRVRRSGDWVIIEDGPVEGAPWPRAYAEHTLALYVLTLRAWTGAPLKPLVTSFSHPQPADLSAYARVFGGPLQFDAPSLRLTFQQEVLDIPIIDAEPLLRGHLEDRATRLLTELPASRLGDRIRKLLRDDLSKHGSLASVARQQKTGARTLQRQLASEGVTFAELLSEVRREEAERLLSLTELSIDECASRCGFAHTSAFRRAFRRWTGGSPAAYRKARLRHGDGQLHQ